MAFLDDIFLLFMMSKKEHDFVHIHAFADGDPNIVRHLDFRDRLNAALDLRNQYAQLKQNLIDKGVSRQAYPEAKNDFINKVLESK